jgi:adenylate kinase family enzyme
MDKYNIEDPDIIIERYESGYQVPYLYDKIIEIPLADRKKYNIKPYPDWTTRDLICDKKYTHIHGDLVEYCKTKKLDVLFLIDVGKMLRRDYNWESAVIFWYNYRKPTHPMIRAYSLRQKRGYIKNK